MVEAKTKGSKVMLPAAAPSQAMNAAWNSHMGQHHPKHRQPRVLASWRPPRHRDTTLGSLHLSNYLSLAGKFSMKRLPQTPLPRTGVLKVPSTLRELPGFPLKPTKAPCRPSVWPPHGKWDLCSDAMAMSSGSSPAQPCPIQSNPARPEQILPTECY